MKLKGNMVIELVDGNTGEEERIEEGNMVTNAVNDILGLNPMGIFYAVAGEYDTHLLWNDKLLPICPNMVGGILLYSDPLEEDADNISRFRLFIRQVDLHIIPHQRLNLIFSENSLCLTLYQSLCRVYIIKPGNALYNFSLHNAFPYPVYSAANCTGLRISFPSEVPSKVVVLPSSLVTVVASVTFTY